MNKILIPLLIASFFLFSYKLDSIPPGIDNDEADRAYDAYSIAMTGKDQWGSTMPLYFKGFGDYRLPIPTYSIVPFVYLFGFVPHVARFPSVLFGILSVVGTFYLGAYFFGKKAGLLSAFFLAFSPWFIGLVRVGLEASFATCFMIWGTVFFLWARRKTLWFIPSALTFGLSMYSYYAHRLVVPIFILGLFFLYYRNIQSFKKTFTFIFIFGLCVLPIIISLFTHSGQARIGQVVFTNDIGTINMVNEHRTACEKQLSSHLCKLTHNKGTALASVLLANYSAHFSLETLFFSGYESALSVKPPGSLFLSGEILFAILGILLLIKNRVRQSLLFVWWILLAPIPDSLTGLGHFARFFIVLPAWQIVSGYSVKFLGTFRIIRTVFALFIVVQIFYFLSSYFGAFPIVYASRSHYEYRPLFESLLRYEKDFPAIYISSAQYDTKHYIFYLLYSQYDPSTFQKNVDIVRSDDGGGWIHVQRIGKWNFVQSIPEITNIPTNSLVVGHPNEFKNKYLRPLEITYSKDGKEAFYILPTCSQEESELFQQSLLDNALTDKLSECYY